MRMAVFAGLGMVCCLYFTCVRHATGSVRFGRLVAALMGAAVTRGPMIRAEPRPRLGGH